MFLQVLDFSFIHAQLFLLLEEIGLVGSGFLVLPDWNHEDGVAFGVFVDVEIIIDVWRILFLVVMMEGHGWKGVFRLGYLTEFDDRQQ